MTQLNPLIPLSVKPLELGRSILEGREIADNRLLRDQRIAESEARSGLIEQQTNASQQAAAMAAENHNIKSVATGVLSMQGDIQSGNWAGVVSNLEQRAKMIQKAGGDPTETLEGIELIKSGNTDEFTQYADFAVREAFNRGLLQRKETKYGNAIEGIDPDGNPAFFQLGDDGTTRRVDGFAPKPNETATNFVEVVDPNDESKTKFVPESEKQNYLPKDNKAKSKERTAGQQKEEGFYDSMASASMIIQELESKDGFDPVVWQFGGFRPNATIGDDEQKYMQAGMQWARAKLRSESGANITADEEKNEYKTYFPQLGDSAETIKQKSYARSVAEASMRKKAGLKSPSDMTDEELEKALGL